MIDTLVITYCLIAGLLGSPCKNWQTPAVKAPAPIVEVCEEKPCTPPPPPQAEEIPRPSPAHEGS